MVDFPEMDTNAKARRLHRVVKKNKDVKEEHNATSTFYFAVVPQLSGRWNSTQQKIFILSFK
jgi:hypothetical protein